ncbi:alpha/beta fold hydrolase [Kitasatospora aureofaciens]|uniref:alpha/beta fold hydrolase n=1 Tax=Kitasatospora aureofaciens TaxID=1894 RepID=UPI0036F48EA5
MTRTAAAADRIEQWARQPLRRAAPAEPAASYARRPLDYTLEAFRASSPVRFEEMCRELLERDGFTSAERVGGAGTPGRQPAGRRQAAPVRPEACRHTVRVQVIGQPVTAAAWQQVSSTYLICAQDRGTPPRLQREFARRAGSVVELDASHHPFLSQPAAVRDLLLSL